MNQNGPLFSIVIANYNYSQFLEQAIQSILNQSCQDFELIIVDGGSTDNSVEIITKYSEKLSWWVSEKDKGQSDAFNKGFAKAKGQFYFWLNADDLLLPKSLEYAKNAIIKYPDTLWFAANTVFFSKEGFIQRCSRGPNWKNYLLKNAPIYVYGPTTIFHQSIFRDAGGFEECLNYSMDTDLWLRFMSNGIRFKRIDKYFWGFRLHEKSKTTHTFSSVPTNEYLQEQIYICKKHSLRYTKSGRIKQTIYKSLFGCYLLALRDRILMKGKKIESLRF